MWTGVMLSLVLCQATPKPPTVVATGINETRAKQLEKEAFFFSNSGLTINAEVRGPLVKEAVKFGNLKVTQANDDMKTDLIKKAKPDSFTFDLTDQPDYKLVDDFSRPKDTNNLRFMVSLKETPRTAKKFSVKGTLDLMTGTPGSAEFAKVKSLEGTTLANKDLDALKIKFSVVKPDKNFFGKPEQALIMKVEGDERPITEIQLLDAAGKKIDAYPFWEKNEKEKTKKVTLNLSTNIPSDAKLEVKFLKASKVTAVPFEFKDVELP